MTRRPVSFLPVSFLTRRPLLAGLLGALSVSALATTAPVLTLEQQAKKAEVIVRAVLGPAATVQEGAVTYTVFPLSDVRDVVAGNVGALPLHEGRPALFFLRGVDDLPALASGQEVFALLYAAKADSPLVGFNQGLYPVVNGQVTWNSVTKVRVDALARAEAERQAATPPAPPTPPAPTPPAPTPPAPTPPAPTPAPTTPPATGTMGTAPAADGLAATPAALPAPSSVPTLITDPDQFRAALLAARGGK